MSNSINQGPERVSPPDKDGVVSKRAGTAVEDLAAEVARASTARATGASAAEIRELSSLTSRGDLRDAALNELKLSSPEATRLVSLPANLAQKWADLDATEFARLRAPERKEAAIEAVAATARLVPEYASELAQRAPTLAKAAESFNQQLAQVQAERDRRQAEVQAQAQAQLQANSQEGGKASDRAAFERMTLDADALARIADMRAQQSREVYAALAADRQANEAVARAAESRAAQAASQAEAIQASAFATVARRRAEDSRAAAEALGLVPESERAHRQPQTQPALQGGQDIPTQSSNAALNARGTGDRGAAPEASSDLTGEAARRALKRPVLEEEVPDEIRRRYLVTQEKSDLLDRGRTEFTFRGGERDGQMAFADVGKQLTTKTEDKDVIRAMVTVATAKGWSEVTVNGTDEFKRAAWLEARLSGLQVHGYEPKEADKRRLAELEQDKAPTNAIAQAVPQRTRETGRELGREDATNLEALRARLVLEVASPSPDREERAKLARAGDTRSQAAMRADAELRSERDMATIRAMSAGQLKELARWVDAGPSADKEQRIRAVLDGAGRHEPAYDEKVLKDRPSPSASPSASRVAPEAPRGVQVDGDALSPKERKVMEGMGALLKDRGYGPEFVEATLAEVENRMRRQRVHVGELIEHGPAHYQGDRAKDMSYYVTLKTATGVETVWGKRLGSAIQDGNVKEGDQIVLINTGKKAVDVTERGVGEAGQVTARRKPAALNEWAARPIDRLTSFEREDVNRRAVLQPVLQVYDPKAERQVSHTPPERDRVFSERLALGRHADRPPER